MIAEFAPSLFVADGPTVSFYGFPYTTRMAMVRLRGDNVWIWSPVALTEEILEFVGQLGQVRYIVSPNKIHHLFLADWAQRFPEAKLYAPPGLARRKPDLKFDFELHDEPDPAWADEIDQVIFRGSLAMEEVVFFHRASRTAIFCDLIQRFPESAAKGWRGAIMRLDGLVGEKGSAPREWRATFLKRAKARAARTKVLGWQPEKLIVAHGDCESANALPVIRRTLNWI